MKCSSACVLIRLVLKAIRAFLTGEVRVVSAWYQSFGLQISRTRRIRTKRKNSPEIGLVISNTNDSLEMGSVVSQNECEEYIFKDENNFFFENVNQLFVFEYYFYIDLDNQVYKDFAYTSDPRVFEVLIYWIDIESHYSRPWMF